MKLLFSIIASTLVSISAFSQGKSYVKTDGFADSYSPIKNAVWDHAQINDIFIFTCPMSMASEGNFAPTPSSFDAFIMTEHGPDKITVEIKGDNAITAKLMPIFIKPGNGAWVQDKATGYLNYRYFYPVKMTNVQGYIDQQGIVTYIMDMYVRY